MESTFVDLRRLADWFTFARTPALPMHIERIAKKLDVRCVPLLGRMVADRDATRREAARRALGKLAIGNARARIIAELHRIAAGDACDEGKVCALGLLAELGQRGAARFADPGAIQRRSALALASQLDNVADIAAAGDMMIRQLSDEEIVHLLEVMVGASQGAAYHLAAELCARLDLAVETRERIATLALGTNVPLPCADRPPRPTHVALLVDITGRGVVIASRKISGERRWRRWAVLIGSDGMIEDCVHEEISGYDADHAPLVAALVADGYRVASTDVERARGIIAAAARHSAQSDDHERLTSAYYLGRDLLDLGEAHLGGRAHPHPTAATLGRAVELIADGDVARAQILLARCGESADVIAAQAACLLAQHRPSDAIRLLLGAVELEPEFPLHHWNLAAALHQVGDTSGCHAALERFLATTARPSGLYADPEQAARVALATRMIAQHERSARLSGTPLPPSRRKRRRAAKP